MFYPLEIMIDIDMENLASANDFRGKPMDFHIQVQIACFFLSETPIFSGFWLLQSEFSTLIEPRSASNPQSWLVHFRMSTIIPLVDDFGKTHTK